MAETSGETPRLTLREAAERTGIPLDALRKRVYRGTIPAEKIDGQYTILASDLAAIATDHEPPRPGAASVETRPRTGSDTGETQDRTAGETAPDSLALDYIASLKSEITFLRTELETRTDELQRRDVLLREALGRIPQLSAGESSGPPAASPAGQGEEMERDRTPNTSQESRSWWRRLFGGG